MRGTRAVQTIGPVLGILVFQSEGLADHLATTEASMPAEAMRWYRSKVDWWIALLLCVPPAASIAVCVALVLAGKTSELPWGLVSVLFVLGLYFGLVFPLRYGLDDTHLLVRFGVCRRRIPLAAISEVRPTHNPLRSAPALSLDRLHVQYGQGFFKAMMISPTDRNGFLDDLAQRAGLKREGDRLVRV
jgi:Bacterial PH domain